MQKSQPALTNCGRSFLHHPCSEEDDRAVQIKTSGLNNALFLVQDFACFFEFVLQ